MNRTEMIQKIAKEMKKQLPATQDVENMLKRLPDLQLAAMAFEMGI